MHGNFAQATGQMAPISHSSQGEWHRGITIAINITVTIRTAIATGQKRVNGIKLWQVTGRIAMALHYHCH